MKTLRHLALLLGLALAGCVNTPPTLSSTPEVASNPFTSLRKNMTGASVKALLGEPRSVHAFASDILKEKGVTVEVWEYQRSVASTTMLIQIGTKDVPYSTPFTKEILYRKEPVYETRSMEVFEVIELMLIDDQLLEWDTHRDTRQFGS